MPFATTICAIVRVRADSTVCGKALTAHQQAADVRLNRPTRDLTPTHDLFAFLTTEPNVVVGPVHPKAMPVILTTPEEIEI